MPKGKWLGSPGPATPIQLFNLTLVKFQLIDLMKTKVKNNKNIYLTVFTGHGFLNVLSFPFLYVRSPGHLWESLYSVGGKAPV